MQTQWHILFSWPAIVVLAVLAVLIGLAIVYYWNPIPPLGTWRKRFLTALRILALCSVFLLLMSPVLEVVWQEEQPPRVAVLLDASASMKLPENYGLRGDSLRYLLENLRSRAERDSLQWSFFRFDVTTESLSPADTLDFAVDGTNLAQALSTVVDSLSNQNLQAIVLATDGIYNQGPDPRALSKTIPVPVYTVQIGSSQPPGDLQLVRMETNSIVYQGDVVPIRVVLRQSGFAGQKAVLLFYEGGNLVEQKTVSLGADGFEQVVQLEWTPRHPGKARLQVQLKPLAGEVTDLNNQQEKRVHVLRRKHRVLVLSGGPDFDRQMLGFLAGQLADFSFTFRTEAGPGKFFEGSFEQVPLDSFDLVILHGFPTARSAPAQVQKLFSSLDRRKVPLVWFLNTRVHPASLKGLKLAPAFRIKSALRKLEHRSVRLTQGGVFHPLMVEEEAPLPVEQLWQDLPPVQLMGGMLPAEGSQILLEAVGSGARGTQNAAIPVMWTYRHGGKKQFVLAASGWGFWHFQLQEDPVRAQMFLHFLDRLLRWSINQENIHLVQIQPVRDMVNLGEPVTFSGKVYDDFYRPLEDAEVRIQLHTPQGTELVDEFTPGGQGQYQLTLSGLQEGEYSYEIIASRKGREIGRRKGRLVVRPFYLEFQEIPAREQLLREIARQTGGRYFRVGAFLRHFPDRPFSQSVRLSSWEKPLWKSPWWLVFIIGILSLEWFFRKRWNLL